MSVIVRDDGFVTDDWTTPVVPLADWTGRESGVAVSPQDDLAAVEALVGAGSPRTEGAAEPSAPAMIRVAFAAFADGRGFTIARRLRDLGYSGRLRAAGHLIADQYAMARRAGFDEVEIDDALAARQPQAQWTARADWQAHDYRARLGAARGRAFNRTA